MSRQPRFPSQRTLAPQPPPPGLCASTYTPELGAAICRRIAAGESLRSICRADPAMPTEKTVWNWARAHEDFSMMKTHAQSVARTRSLDAQMTRDDARWAPGPLGAPFGGPNGHTGRPSGYGPEIADAIMRRVMMGEGLVAICRDPDMPCVGTVYNWLRRHPAFLEDYLRSKALVEEIMVEQAVDPLPFESERKSWALLRRTVRAAEKAAARLSHKRYAPPKGPSELTVVAQAPDGSRKVIYREGPGGRSTD